MTLDPSRSREAAVIVPAHNEERGLPRLLDALAGLDAEIVVIANGCTDATAAAARRYPGVTVLETPVPSKIKALALGDRHSTAYPRVYVDADVVIDAAGVRALCAALTEHGVHAAGPAREIPMEGAGWAVRRYYELWQRLDGVREELFGRGVVAVDRTGHERIGAWPEVMSDDLVMAMSFVPAERVVVPAARAVIRPPRTYADLLRRRVRVVSGNRAAAGTSGLRRSATGLRQVAHLVRREPRLLPAAVVFIGTAVLAKVRGEIAVRRGRTAWLRDESSRTV